MHTKDSHTNAIHEVMQDLKSPIFITAGERSIACGRKKETPLPERQN
jgi:hypothetical protein